MYGSCAAMIIMIIKKKYCKVKDWWNLVSKTFPPYGEHALPFSKSWSLRYWPYKTLYCPIFVCFYYSPGCIGGHEIHYNVTARSPWGLFSKLIGNRFINFFLPKEGLQYKNQVLYRLYGSTLYKIFIKSILKPHC